MTSELPVSLGNNILAMPASLTLEWLKELNVSAVNLANNHTMDLGTEPFHKMSKLLVDAGIKVLRARFRRRSGVAADRRAYRSIIVPAEMLVSLKMLMLRTWRNPWRSPRFSQ